MCTLSAERATVASLWLDSFHLETMEYSVSSQLKAEKEAFVTGHSGTTMLEVATVVAVGPVCSAQPRRRAGRVMSHHRRELQVSMVLSRMIHAALGQVRIGVLGEMSLRVSRQHSCCSMLIALHRSALRWPRLRSPRFCALPRRTWRPTCSSPWLRWCVSLRPASMPWMDGGAFAILLLQSARKQPRSSSSG